MTVVFGFVSEMLRQFFGLVGQGLNQSNIQNTFQVQPLLIVVSVSYTHLLSFSDGDHVLSSL